MSIRLSATGAETPSAACSRAGSQLIAGLKFLVGALLLSGCVFLPSGPLPQPAGTPASARVSGVPFFAQEQWQCGPAALAMVLGWSGVARHPAELVDEVYSPDLKGSLQSAMVGAARRNGRVAYPLVGSEALLSEIAAGHPVIVLVNLGLSWYPKWHYAVVIGYNQLQGEVLLHSGLTAYETLGTRVFMNIWRRSDEWGLLVLPPDRLPAVASEFAWLDAVAGLELVEQWQPANDGYAAALERWPQSFAAWMGLGNSSYHLGNLEASAAAFQQAGRLQPENGAAFNNLAQVLAEQGNRSAALDAARQAVDLGGPLQALFQQTYEAIRAGVKLGP